MPSSNSVEQWVYGAVPFLVWGRVRVSFLCREERLPRGSFGIEGTFLDVFVKVCVEL